MSPHYLRLLNDASFYSQQTFSFPQRLHATPPLCTPVDALCCSAGRTAAPTRTAKTISWFARGLRHCKTLWKFLETSVMLPCSRQTDMSTEVLWSKAIKRQIQLWHGQKNFCWATGPFRSQQWDLPAWSGQVQTYANDYSQFFSLDPNFSNSFTFCSDDHTCPRTRALTAEKWLCWKIKPKAPTGATEDQIIGIGENLWNCCIKSQVKKQEKKNWKEHLLFKAFFSR